MAHRWLAQHCYFIRAISREFTLRKVNEKMILTSGIDVLRMCSISSGLLDSLLCIVV